MAQRGSLPTHLSIYPYLWPCQALLIFIFIEFITTWYISMSLGIFFSPKSPAPEIKLELCRPFINT